MSFVVEISILIIAISILIALLIGSISIALFLKSISNYNKKKIKLSELSLYDQVYSSRGNIDEMLNEYIESQFNEYKIFNPDIFQSEYLSGNDIEKVASELRKQVLTNISPALLNEASLIYNKAKLYTIITNKVNMAVINEGVIHNSDVEQISNIFGDAPDDFYPSA